MKVIKRKGTFCQYSNMTWGIDTKIKVGNEFKHLQKRGFSTLSEAKASFESVKEEFLKQSSFYFEPMGYKELKEEYLKTKKLLLTNSSLYTYKTAMSAHFDSFFKGKDLKHMFERTLIKKWHSKIIDIPTIDYRRKNVLIRIMKDLLKFTYNNEYIDPKTYQSCDVILVTMRNDYKKKTERPCWTLAELNKFLNAIPEDSEDFLMFKLFFVCSPRISEFLALMPKCYDSRKKRISIEQQVLYENGKNKPQALTDRLKTRDSYRKIAIPDDLADLLESYIVTFEVKDNEFLFCGKDRKTPLGKTTFRRKLLKYCKIAGVKELNPHGARHTMATILASVCVTGDDWESSAQRLGHSPQMFMNTYAKHNNEKTEEDLLKKALA